MQRHALLSLAAGALTARACEIPADPPSNTITEGFGLKIQSSEFPVIDGKFLNLFEAGGGDEHLYLSPIGAYAFDLTLNQGVLERGIIHAVINGEYLASDNTTKMFMTERGDPKALYQATYACNPTTDALQVELSFVQRQSDDAGGNICVRSGAMDGYEFRYSPPGNTAYDPTRPCMAVTLVVDRSGPPPDATITSSTTTADPTPTVTPGLFADVTAEGFAFVGCAPEEANANDGLSVRTLPDAMVANDALTNEVCVKSCAALGYKYAGSEYSRECWCANAYPPTRKPGTTVESLAGCQMRCAGDPSQWCGGSGWLSLYEACAEGQACVNAEFGAGTPTITSSSSTAESTSESTVESTPEPTPTAPSTLKRRVEVVF